jgi:hypothetical protein
MSPHLEDFPFGDLVDTNLTIKAFGGTKTHAVKRGTMLWKWEDDEGMVHDFAIEGSYYVPESDYRLLSPQHWAQSQKDPDRFGTGCFTDGQACHLWWKGRKYHLTVPLSKGDNVATFRLAPGYEKFHAFCAELQADDNDPYSVDLQEADQQTEESEELSSTERGEKEWLPRDINKPVETDFSLDGTEVEEPTIQYEEVQQDGSLTPAAELLRMHHRFNHTPMSKLQTMARQGILPRRLSKCEIPACAACLYMKAKRRPWRTKSTKEGQDVSKPKRPGDLVSVDQLKSPIPGFVAQITGILTKKRYNYATVFVDQASRLSYVHLQKTQSVEETLEAKTAFERFAASKGVTVKAYHADNGIFTANGWQNACRDSRQGLTFAGVNAHHSNGLAERRIKELQDMARASMAHASSKWKEAVTAHLWPYAIKEVNHVLNATPNLQDAGNLTPEQIFSGSKVNINPKHYRPFGCPVYVLDSNLQQKKPHSKWKERARVGLYLGRSPQHPRNVALVLNLQTGHVSPQFHLEFDPRFETLSQHTPRLESKWQALAGMTNQREEKKVRWREVPADTPPQAKKQKTQSSSNNTDEDNQKELSKPDNESIDRTSAELLDNPLGQSGDDQEEAPQSEGVVSPSTEQQLQPPEEINPTQSQGRPKRNIKPPQRLIEAMLAEMKPTAPASVEGEIYCLQALFPDAIDAPQEGEHHPLTAYKATSDPDTMYMHEAMQEPDAPKFIEAMVKEVKDQ